MGKTFKQKFAMFNKRYQDKIDLLGGAVVGAAIIRLLNNNIFFMDYSYFISYWYNYK